MFCNIVDIIFVETDKVVRQRKHCKPVYTLMSKKSPGRACYYGYR
jgi:hypothetical protein